MDIGLEKLIEMIEQRLGRWAANILLGLIVIAVVSVCLHLTWDYLVKPIWTVASGAWPWIKTVLMPQLSQQTVSKSAENMTAAIHRLQLIRIVLWFAYGVTTAVFLYLVGRIFRLLLNDHKIAKDIRNNPTSVLTKEKADKFLERARMGLTKRD